MELHHSSEPEAPEKVTKLFLNTPLANLFDLSGHVAVVTGGNGGIGRSIALGLAQAGAAIAVLARNEEGSSRRMRRRGRVSGVP
jgi:shikimate 5-dehydrogenase